MYIITATYRGQKITRTAFGDFQAFTIINQLARERELDLQKRERALYAREAVANAGLDKNLADEFVGMDKETVDKCLKIIAPYAQKMKEPFLNAVGPTNGGGGVGSDNEIRAAMGLKKR